MMQAKQLPHRRSRSARFTRRGLIGAGIITCLTFLFIFALIQSMLGKGTGGDHFRATRESAGPRGVDLPRHTGAATRGEGEVCRSDDGNPEAMPYTENLEELLRLLQVYAAYRGVRVNTSYYPPSWASVMAAGEGRAKEVQPAVGVAAKDEGEMFERLKEGLRDDGGAHGAQQLLLPWVLDHPSVLKAEQETYVERFLAPTQAAVELTPLRVITSHYNPHGSHSLHRMAAETEKAMNDNGYAVHIQRSPTFYDVSHAARRGYGQEGSIFVVIPFALADITEDMMAAIQRRATTKSDVAKTEGAPAHSGFEDLDDFVGDDGFKEMRFTATRCAMTVESIFRQAHRGVAVTVGTIDLVTVSGITSARELNFSSTDDVMLPLRAVDRAPLSATRRRRYSRITCEPPDFRSGWDDAHYGFRWKDNLRQRRVVVPLTKLQEDAAASTRKAIRVEERRSRSTVDASYLEERFDLSYVSRYSVLQLYRGESYIFFLGSGALALPNWDLKLRLLYLRTPLRERAVLSSRPTAGVAWIAAATAIVKEWATNPLLHRPSIRSETETTGKESGPHAGQLQQQQPKGPVHSGLGLGEAEKMLGNSPAADGAAAGDPLRDLPGDVAAWVSAAQREIELGLWLVTPDWLWPTVVGVVAEWAAMTNNATAAPTDRPASLSLANLFTSSALGGVTRDGLPPYSPAGLRAIEVAFSTSATDANQTVMSSVDRVGRVRGGLSPITSHASPDMFLKSLGETEVYDLLFLEERRAPKPPEPVVDTAGTSSTRSPLPPQQRGATSEEVCGKVGTAAAYYLPTNKALRKRSFEYCWLKQHRKALKQLTHNLVRSTQASTTLQTSSTGKEMCSDGERWMREVIAPAVSACLADMRYLEPLGLSWFRAHAVPVDAATLGGDKVEGPASQQQQWLTNGANTGRLHGVRKGVCDSETIGGAGVTADERLFCTQKATGGDTRRSTVFSEAHEGPPSPFVLQNAASADLLFGPAEAFFPYEQGHQLRTRPRGLTEQLAAGHRSVGEDVPEVPDTRVPEAVEMDSSLQFLSGALTDLHLTTALWMRGWNIFGLTEPVAVGLGNPQRFASTLNLELDKGDKCVLREAETATEEGIPAELSQARVFTREKFWAMMTTHLAAGTPVGAAVNRNTTAAVSTVPWVPDPRHPLRRTLSQWEAFAGVRLDSIRRAEEV